MLNKKIFYANLILLILVITFVVNPFDFQEHVIEIAYAVGDWGNSGNNIYYNTGNVGIGTTGPGLNLHIDQSGTGTRGLRITRSSVNYDITAEGAGMVFNAGNDHMLFKAGPSGDTRVYIKNDGNVGIGTTVPGSKLQVNGNAVGTAIDIAQIQIKGSSNTNQQLRIGYDTTSDYGWIQSVKEGTNQMPLTLNPDGGNVGIGTTGPVVILHARKDVDNEATIRIQNNSSGTGAYAQFQLLNDSGVSALLRYYSQFFTTSGRDIAESLLIENSKDGGITIAATHPSGPVRFYAGGATERMRINTAGNVGIGTTGPGSLLEISNSSGGITKGISVVNSGQTYGKFKLWPGTASPDGGFLTFGNGTGWKFHIGLDSDSGATKFVTVQDNGNVGIGTTNPGAKLEVNGAIRLVPQGQPASLVNGMIWME